MQPAAGSAVDYDPFAEGELARVVSTTEPQREVWLADQLGEDASLAFNESSSLRLRGTLDRDALHAALERLVARHDALRSSFGPDGESLCVRPVGSLALPFTDLSPMDAGARDAALAARLHSVVETPFRLDRDDLFRAELLRLSDDEHLLVLTAHHIVCDGWSWWVLVQDLGMLYAIACGTDTGPLPPAEAFSDYAVTEAAHVAGTATAADEAYWLSRFADGAPVLDLPTDRPRPHRRSFASRREDHVIDAELVAAVRRMGARRGTSMFATLLAGFASVVSRLAGQSQVIVGIPAAGQSVDGHDHLVGHCVNLLPLRFELDPAQPFQQLLGDAQDTLLDAIEHQRYTFGTLLQKVKVERDPARLPLVSVMFNIDQALERETTGFPGLSMDFRSNPRSYENFEIFINAVHAHGALTLECQYNTDLFDADTIRRWLSAYEALLRDAVERPEAAVSSLSLVDADAIAQLAALQPAPVGFDRQLRMHESFEVQCDRDPDRVALEFRGESLSYATLEARANRIAHLLRARGVKRGGLVGIALDRGVDMLAGLLGVLKAGAGYVPLDPQFPADRLAYMAGDAGLAALLTQERHAAQFDLRGRPVLMLDQLDEELAAMPAHRLGRDDDAAEPESVAYVIYTSGSTGRPKGVQVPHRAVANFLVGMQREPGIGPDDRLVAVTTLSFDIAVLELLLPLSVGARIVLADRDTAVDGGALKGLLVDSGATLMQATPATWRLLLEADWAGRPDFAILCGGEPLPSDLAIQLLPRCGALWNVYGPTETTVWSTIARVEQSADQKVPDIHIGHPIANTRIWILDEQGGLCPRGVAGEICIGGDGVTLGYLDRPELTADRFVPDRLAGAPSEGVGQASPLLYRTGDRGRWRADGNLEHLGRLDFQVKVRGYRIELG
ncbi:MAG: non-ribosomal peptide synthetase, partial [Lysobacter sp.]